ncbi:CusA/CzcA family heavy metal efflux RND transporter [Myroides odoratimimus]|uniref:CusA/CzcA family heavy metal efflux RND transporter n=1 Tax=Myroides odoratimimus TaxID=76832 RepID=UPI001CE16E21|nr:CusA/CzcA family heavy metal efflux RND transporter [Myroides odoratimimus]MCA4820062.1 CusA/CzcA family heavy metal efflux RND transporter [Myroides odoratimimus]
MLNKIIEFSVKNKLIIGLFVLALIGVGIYQTSKLPIDAVPDITDNQVQVITVAPSYGATDIERLVTFPIEQANSNIPGIKNMRSFSRFGLSLVTIVFDEDVDIYWARQQVGERLNQIKADIPQDIGQPELGPISTGLGEIYQYVVRPLEGYEDKFDLTELRSIQDWVVRRQLLSVKGVAEVSSFGGKLKQYEIAVNSNKLDAYGITINDVFSALENNNENTGGAYIEKGPTVLYIRTEGLVASIEDIENIAITSKNTELPLLIRDVAKVQIGHATRYGAMTYNDKGEVSGAVVMMLKGENSNDVIKNVKDKVAEIQKTLPEGVVIEPFLDRTKMVNNAIGTVETNLTEGALIVVFVLVLFLGNMRAGLLVASIIPLAMLFAICMMNLFGVSGNLMSLGALDFGLIIDGAVIIVEAVLHQFSHNARYKSMNKLSQEDMNKTVVHSASKMMNSAVFGQIIILIVYIPILTLEGIEGKMFKPMAQTVAFALLGAFLLSLTYVPMMSSLIMSRKVTHKPNFSERVMAKLEKFYQKCLVKVLEIPKTIYAIVGVLFAIALYILSTLGGEFIPSLEEGDFAVDTKVLNGSTLTTTIESTQKTAHILKSRFPEVEKVVTKIGSAEVPTDPMPMDASDMMVILKDKKEWTSAKTFPELAEKMTKALEEVPGVTVGFQFPVQMRFNELMTGARQDVVVKVFGEDLDQLAEIAGKIGNITNTVKGATNLYVEPVTGMPQLMIEYNRPAIARYRLSIAEINRIVNSSLAGQSTGMVYEGEKRFDMVVRMDETNRKNLSDIENLLIPTPLGNQVPLNQLANVEIKEGPNQIQRENAQRRIFVGFNVKDRDVQSIVEELQEKVEAQIKLPTGYQITYGGQFENLNEAKERLAIAVPLALVLIFLLLFFAFRDIRECLMIFTAIPLSIIGGVFLLALRGMPFSISAGVGFIALFGVAVLNGIVLIAEFNRLQKSGIKNIVFIVVRGAKSRLRPVLMTACVASFGFLPMALSNGAGAEVQRPLATVVIGGLMLATFLTLFILPLLYITFEQKLHFSFMKKKKAITAIAIFLGLGLSVQAQTPISLENALAQAIENNSTIRAEKLKTEYAKAFIRTATDIQQTTITGEFGQINGPYTDNKFSISQDFAFPTVYNKQKNVYKAEHQQSIYNLNLKGYELKKTVTQNFYDFIYWQEKEALLLRADSLYANFYNKATLRLQKGESNILEKTMAQNQQLSIQAQLGEVQKTKQLIQLQLQYLLNTSENIVPSLEQKKLELSSLESDLENNPVLQLIENQKIIAQEQTKLERSKQLPNLQAAYNNSSFMGMAANDVYYDRNNRFHSFQVGISLPLFTSGQRGRVKSAKVAEEVAEAEYTMTRDLMNSRYQQLLIAHQNNQGILNKYESFSFDNSNTITKTAQLQFINGDINYLEYVMLINQALETVNKYLDTLKMYNDNIIQINYLTSNN